MKLILQAIKSLLRSLQNSIRATQKAVADAETKAEEAKSIANDAYVAVNDKADKSDLPTALPNPNALIFSGAVEGTYDGSEPMTVEIPSDSHINNLINTALGVIENGTY